MSRGIGAKGQAKIDEVMREFRLGRLKTSAGKAVRSRQQATAIALSEGRKVSRVKRRKKK